MGSGPAAAATAMALTRRPDVEVTVIDVGLLLEGERQSAVEILAGQDAAAWDSDMAALISEQPVRQAGSRGLPEKRAYGSNFPFRDIGQLDGIAAAPPANRSVVSGAYGGFSNVWGAQVMPFADSVFATWPVGAPTMRTHYECVLEQIPFAAEPDDLAEHFPLIGNAVPLPEVSFRTAAVLSAYSRHRSRINALGMTIGKARLAFRAGGCVRIGLCMTGCPYSLVYSASQTFDALRAAGRVTYHSGLLALEVGERDGRPRVVTKELATGTLRNFEADRIFLACGGIGTTRLVLNSLRLFGLELTMGESQQFTLPFLSRRASPDPRNEPQFTLNQFNATVAMDDEGYELSQLHFYTYNPAFADALPRALRMRITAAGKWQLLRRLTVALGYLPSWNSPRLAVRALGPRRPDALPELQISKTPAPPARRRMLRSVMARVARAAPQLDLYPILPMLRLSAAGKSYHWGGSFPHQAHPDSRFSTDVLGRPLGWRHIHLVDASVFPSVAATTFTLTVMANAHRIATEALHLDD